MGTKEAVDENKRGYCGACRERKIKTYMKEEGGRIVDKPRTTLLQFLSLNRCKQLRGLACHDKTEAETTV